tara:strand:- start:25 stop:594 length:570 start_codon:yes stop_codon:yes gene_type:complete
MSVLGKRASLTSVACIGDVLGVLFDDQTYHYGKVVKLVGSGFKIKWQNPEIGQLKFEIITGAQKMKIQPPPQKKQKKQKIPLSGVYLVALFGIETGEFRGTKFGMGKVITKRELDYDNGTETYKTFRRVYLNTRDRGLFETMLKKECVLRDWIIPKRKEYISKSVSLKRSIKMFEDVHARFLIQQQKTA